MRILHSLIILLTLSATSAMAQVAQVDPAPVEPGGAQNGLILLVLALIILLLMLPMVMWHFVRRMKDITDSEIKKARDEAAAAKALLSQLPVAWCVLDTVGTVTHASETFSASLGISADAKLDISPSVTELIKQCVPTGPVAVSVTINQVSQSVMLNKSGDKLSLVITTESESSDTISTETSASDSQSDAQPDVAVSHVMALRTVVSGVTHEINNPNNFIMFNTSLVKQMFEGIERVVKDSDQDLMTKSVGKHDLGTTMSKMRELLDGIAKGSETIETVVNNLRAFYRPRQSDQAQTDLDLNAVVTSTINLLRYKMEKAGATIQLDLADGLPLIPGREEGLQHIIIQLVNHAFEALEGKSGEIRVVTEAGAHGKLVLLRIQDTGAGIEEARLALLNQPTADGGSSVGVGLSTIHTVVREHNGRIRFHSAAGQTEAVVEFGMA